MYVEATGHAIHSSITRVLLVDVYHIHVMASRPREKVARQRGVWAMRANRKHQAERNNISTAKLRHKTVKALRTQLDSTSTIIASVERLQRSTVYRVCRDALEYLNIYRYASGIPLWT